MDYDYRGEDVEFAPCDKCGMHFGKKFASQRTCWACWRETEAGKEWERKKAGTTGWNSDFAARERQRKQAQEQEQQKARPRDEGPSYEELLRRAQQAENQRKYDEAAKKRRQREYEEFAQKQRAQRDRARSDHYDPFGAKGDPFGSSWYDDPFGFGSKEDFKRKYEQPQQPRQQPRDLTLDADLLKKLIMLCHPDKHGGSELSNSVTKELLRMKGNVR